MKLRTRIEPFVWLLFSGGGVISALLVPVLVVLFGILIPLGLVNPSYAHLQSVATNPLTRLALLGLSVLGLFHFAHRFRFTLKDGLKLRRLDPVIALLCYGAAVVGSVIALWVLLML